MFNFLIKKAFDFLWLNKSDSLKVLKLNNFNIPDLGNLLIQKLDLINIILIFNVINTSNTVYTCLVTTKSRANYAFFIIIFILLKSNLLFARVEFKTTSKLILTLELLIKMYF